MNYGFNVDFLSNKYGDFFIWRSPGEAYRPSPFTNMGRESNNFRIDPFFNFTNPERGTSHKVKGRFYYSADNVVRPTQSASITDILGNMGTERTSHPEHCQWRLHSPPATDDRSYQMAGKRQAE